MYKTFLPLLFLSLSAGGFAQPSGTITGMVLDEGGHAVAHAEVFIDVMQFHARKIVKTWETAADGSFTIGSVSWGTYSAYAMKEEEGYPDSSIGLYGNGVVRTVAVSPISPSANAISTSAILGAPLLVPSRVPTQIKVSAPGYSDWYYPGTTDPAASVPVVFQPDEERSFDVHLRPLPGQVNTESPTATGAPAKAVDPLIPK